MLSKTKILCWLEPLIVQASEAPDSQTVLEISKEILEKIDHILKELQRRTRQEYLMKRRGA
jgi:hypothetical protein